MEEAASVAEAIIGLWVLDNNVPNKKVISFYKKPLWEQSCDSLLHTSLWVHCKFMVDQREVLFPSFSKIMHIYLSLSAPGSEVMYNVSAR